MFFTYNSLGKVETVTDPLNQSRTFAYNARGQNTSATNELENDSFAAYDTLGNVTALTGPLGASTAYTYDVLGRRIAESTPSGGTVSFGYNELNLREQITNARGQTRKFFYDAMGRITGSVGAEDSVSYTYDENGNLLTVTDENGTVTRTYDENNRVTSYTDTYGNTIRYAYDALGRLSLLTYPDSTAVYYGYDEAGNLANVTDWANRVTTYTYDENNRVVGETKPDGSVTTTVYDAAGRVTSTETRSASGAVISSFAYTYDALSRIVGEKVLDKNLEFCYNYDRTSNLVERLSMDEYNNITTDGAYTYDAAGNIVSSNGAVLAYDGNNRLSSVDGLPVTYDADGNMTGAPGSVNTFAYDSANRLISADDHAYTYNAENTRIRNTCGQYDTTYIYNTNCRLSQLLMKTTNGITTKYVYGLGLIGEEKQDCFKTYHFDYRGSTVAITDANGTVTDRFEYDAYGRMTTHTGDSFVIFGYNGRDGVVTDKNGLIYMRARYYSPELCRFVNADLIHGDISHSVTLNRYAYANGNPVSLVDPFGLAPEEGRSGANNEESFTDKLKQVVDTFAESFSANAPVYTASVIYMGFKITLSISAQFGEGELLSTDMFENSFEFLERFSLEVGEKLVADIKDSITLLTYGNDGSMSANLLPSTGGLEYETVIPITKNSSLHVSLTAELASNTDSTPPSPAVVPETVPAVAPQSTPQSSLDTPNQVKKRRRNIFSEIWEWLSSCLWFPPIMMGPDGDYARNPSDKILKRYLVRTY